jgi:hypothetical protein
MTADPITASEAAMILLADRLVGIWRPMKIGGKPFRFSLSTDNNGMLPESAVWTKPTSQAYDRTPICQRGGNKTQKRTQ